MARAALIGVLAGLVVGGVSLAQTDARLWYQAYQDAQRQIEAGQWKAALASLEAAQSRGPRPGRRVPIRADQVGPFNPDYYRGIAYLNLGQFEEADDAFARAASFVVQGDREFPAFQQQRTKARAGRVEVTVKAIEGHIARRDVAAAERALEEAARLGAEAGRLEPYKKQVTTLAARPPVDTPVPTPSPAPPPLAGITPPAPGPGPTQATLNPGPVAPPPVVQPQPSGNRSSAPPTRVVPRPQPPRAVFAGAVPAVGVARIERQAVADFFSGRYEASARALEGMIATGNPSTRARLYYASSVAALALSGGRPVEDLGDARRVAAGAAADGGLEQDRRLISPRVLAALNVQR